MQSSKLTRAWFALTALIALVGLVTQVIATANDSGRVANLLSFFTIDSNLLVLAVSAVVALGLKRSGQVFPVLWLDAFVAIIVTGVVYQVALAGLYDLGGLMYFSDTMLHKVTPLLFVLGWLVAGPRGALTWRAVWWSLAYPVAWLAFTLVRGAITGWYPYPFLDATVHGPGTITVNCLMIAVFFIGLALIGLAVDRTISRRVQAQPAQPA